MCDIEDLKLDKLDYDEHGFAKVGEFTSIYHDKQEEGFSG
jgi:hypothetical protein